MTRRFFLLCLAAAWVALLSSRSSVGAPDYPVHPIRLFAGQSAGGQTDIIARIVARKLSDILGQPFVVRNQPGAAGTIAADLVAKSPADGYTMLLGSQSNLAIAPVINPQLPYEPAHDFAPIARVAHVPYALVVNAHVPARTVGELIVYARSHPGKLTYASQGSASLGALSMEMFAHASGIELVAVPYKDSATALADVATSRIDMMVREVGIVAPHADAGSLRILAVFGSRRSRRTPEVPTFAELGFADLEVTQWYGLVLPRAVPAEVQSRVSTALAEALRSADVRAHLEELGYEPIEETADEFAMALRADTKQFSGVIRRIGAAPGS